MSVRVHAHAHMRGASCPPLLAHRRGAIVDSHPAKSSLGVGSNPGGS